MFPVCPRPGRGLALLSENPDATMDSASILVLPFLYGESSQVTFKSIRVIWIPISCMESTG